MYADEVNGDPWTIGLIETMEFDGEGMKSTYQIKLKF